MKKKISLSRLCFKNKKKICLQVKRLKSLTNKKKEKSEATDLSTQEFPMVFAAG
jgi:hypothetical protein